MRKNYYFVAVRGSKSVWARWFYISHTLYVVCISVLVSPLWQLNGRQTSVKSFEHISWQQRVKPLVFCIERFMWPHGSWTLNLPLLVVHPIHCVGSVLIVTVASPQIINLRTDRTFSYLIHKWNVNRGLLRLNRFYMPCICRNYGHQIHIPKQITWNMKMFVGCTCLR